MSSMERKTMAKNGFSDPAIAKKAGEASRRGKSPFNAEVKQRIGEIIKDKLSQEKFEELYKSLQPKDRLEALKMLLPYVCYTERELLGEESPLLVGGGNNITVEFVTKQKDVIEIKQNEIAD